MLRQRVISALVLAPLALAATWIGSWAFILLIAAGAVVAAWEWTRLCGWSLGWTSAGLVYVGLPAAALLWLRGQDRETAFWVLLVVWATDIAAYAVGRAIGGWRLLPKVSPNKTWAGAIGGIVAAALAGWIVAAGFALSVDPILVAGLSALLALAAQGGDLFESAVKRHFGAKDAGKLIPGHGGLLDRIDGLMAAAPVTKASIQ